MLYHGPIERRDSEALADERFSLEQRNQLFLNAIHEAEHEAWVRHDVEVDHGPLRFGESAHFDLKFSVPDCDPAKMADALEAMARVFRKAGAA